MSANKFSNRRLFVTFTLSCGAVIVGWFLITDVAGSAQNQTYVVTADNSKILGVSTTLPAASFCTPETPCRYDNLEDGFAAYVLSGGSWPNTGLTYSFGALTADLAFGSETALGAQAFGLWGNVARFKAVEVADPTGNMRQWWAVGDHGDGFSFDGPGGVLAHCFYPPPVNAGAIAGDCHYDDAETWVSPGWGGAGIDTVTVLAHEIGHGLGLGHSADPNALMYPYYSSRRAYLSFDDIAGVVAIYGNRAEDVIFQIESLTTVAPGFGSFRLLENSIRVDLHQKGTGAVYQTRFMPSASNTVPVTFDDVDGVLSGDTAGVQFDSYIWHLGDLYRARLTMGATRKDIDQVMVTLNISNNVLLAPTSVTLRVSMNGRVLGDIVVSPGNVVRTATFNLNPPFVNPSGGLRREGENVYNKATH